MPRQSWSFVDPQVRACDVVCFVMVATYLLLVWCWLVATRRLHSGLSLHEVVRRVGRWRYNVKSRVVRLIRGPAESRKAA
jgi:hypothetical protein